MPYKQLTGSFPYRTYRIPKSHRCGRCRSFHNTASGKTHKLWTHSLKLCEDLGMEPLYVCNCGMTCQGRKSVLLEGEALDEMVQDTLDAINMLSALRKANGEGFVLLWGIRNPLK